MDRIRNTIGARCAGLAEHPFIRQLAADLPLSQTVAFVGQIASFVLAFQDLMKILGERAGESPVGDLLRRHCAEEVGHELWYLADVELLTGSLPDVKTLFSAAHAPTRRTVYALATEVMTARDDLERFGLVLMLEELSAICLTAVGAYLTRMGAGAGLMYFGGPHVEAERNHAVRGTDLAASMRALGMAPSGCEERAAAVVERAHRAFTGMLDGLASTIATTAGGRS